MNQFFLVLATAAAIALIWGGVALIRQRQERQKGVLMIVAAVVLIANVAIVAWP